MAVYSPHRAPSLMAQVAEEDRVAEEEEAEGAGVAEIKADHSSEAKRRHLIATMRMMVSPFFKLPLSLPLQ